MSRLILFVDDEPNILVGYKRQLRKQFAIDTALGGEQGIAKIAQEGPYAVVVSDLRMPGMDGIEFLSRVRELAPETVRIVLTGCADLRSTIEAVNQGNIFQFLTKPCHPETFANVLKAGLKQYRLNRAPGERQGSQ